MGEQTKTGKIVISHSPKNNNPGSTNFEKCRYTYIDLPVFHLYQINQESYL